MDTKHPISTNCILTWTEPIITPSGVINLRTKPTWNYPISAFKTLKFKTPLPTFSILTYSLSVSILTLSHRDLNASCSGCLPEFILGFFKFQFMLLEKKSYPTDFSFKFNAIKFGNLLMNWFIWEKIFTYCYNKFRPLNHMHYVKCSVNSL